MPANPSEHAGRMANLLVANPSRGFSALRTVQLSAKTAIWARVFGWVCNSTLRPTQTKDNTTFILRASKDFRGRESTSFYFHQNTSAHRGQRRDLPESPAYTITTAIEPQA